MFAGTLSAQERVLSLSGAWKFTIGDKKVYALPPYNDNHWEKIQVPGTWEDQGFNGYDGYAWYRTQFDGSALPEGPLMLDLGYIDDCDEVYLNGKLIGYSGSFPPKFYTAYDAKRNYTIPETYLNRNGPNVLAVRIFDVTLEGGIVKGSPGIYKVNPPYNMFINLAGVWDLRRGRSENDDWKKIMVPIPWEKDGFNHMDGFAWYRKTFILPKEHEGRDLVFIGGKIDDFDKTYVNGILIGETNDGRRFGSSMSFSKLRKYRIPANVLRPGENVITILVEDMGNVGGIYEGPVGIATQQGFEAFIERRN
jgi:sialate O-acetylesterase